MAFSHLVRFRMLNLTGVEPANARAALLISLHRSRAVRLASVEARSAEGEADLEPEGNGIAPRRARRNHARGLLR